MSDTPTSAPTPVEAAANEIMPTLETDAPVEENTEEVDASPEAEAKAEADQAKKEEAKAKAEIKKWKLKVGGRDIELTDEAELLKRAQMGYSADEKWQEAAKIKKQVEDFVGLLQKDPSEALAMMGMDVDKLAEEHINKRIQEMQKSPEQLEREKLQKELERMKKEKTDIEERARDAEMARLQEQYAVQIESEITEALMETKTLPKSPYVVKRLADTLLLAMNNGYNDVSVRDILPVVEKEIKAEIQQMFSAMPEELVEMVVGKDVLNRVRKKRIAKVQAPETTNSVKSTGSSEKLAKESEKLKEKLAAKDFFKGIGNF